MTQIIMKDLFLVWETEQSVLGDDDKILRN